MVKLKVKIKFDDLKSGKRREKGDVFEVGEARARVLLNKGVVGILRIDKL